MEDKYFIHEFTEGFAVVDGETGERTSAVCPNRERAQLILNQMIAEKQGGEHAPK